MAVAKRLTAEALVKKLGSECVEAQKQAVCEVRLMAKWDMDNRACMREAGAIPLLVNLLPSLDSNIQENAVTALLNLSIYPPNKHAIMEAPNFLDNIFAVMAAAKSMEARRSSAALLFSIMVCREYRSLIGQRSGAIQNLLELMRFNNPAATKDAVKCLFHISLEPQNRVKIVSAGAVPVLFSLLIQGKHGLVEDALAVLAQVATSVESVPDFRTGPYISILADLLETGTAKVQENAASTLLNLCQSGGEAVIEDVLEISTCVMSLSNMLSTGSMRARTKASSLMKLLLVDQQHDKHEEEYLSSSSISTISSR